MKLPGSPGAWLGTIIVTSVVVALIFRVPQLEKIVIGANLSRQG